MQTRVCTCPISHLRTTGGQEARVPSEKMRMLQHADPKVTGGHRHRKTKGRSCAGRSSFHTTLALNDCIFSHMHIQLSTRKTLERFGKGPLKCSCRVASECGESGTRTSPSLSRWDLGEFAWKGRPQVLQGHITRLFPRRRADSVILHTHTLPGLPGNLTGLQSLSLTLPETT